MEKKRKRKLSFKLNLKGWRFGTVKAKLITLSFAVLLIPALLIGYITYSTSASQIEQLLLNAAQENVNLTNTYINSLIVGKENEIKQLAGDIEDTSKQTSQIEAVLKDFVSNHPGTMPPFVATSKGQFVISKKQELPKDFKPMETPWYTEAIQTGEVVITNPYQDTLTGDMSITIAKALSDKSAVVGFNLNMEELKNLTKDVHIGEKGYIVIYSKNKQFLLHPTNKMGTPTQPHNEVMYVQDHGNYEYLLKDEPKKMIYSTNMATGWKVAGNMSKSEIQNITQPILKRTIIVILISLIACSIIVYFVIRSIIRPLNRLSQVAEEISNGDLTHRVEIKKQDEIGKVAQSFNKMADALHAILVEVRDKADQLTASSLQLSESSEQTQKASEQVAETVQALASGTENQVHSVEESSNSISEISASAQQISANAENALATSSHSAQKAAEGSVAIESVVEQMKSIEQTVTGLAAAVEGLGERSEEITKMIELIREISAQTNLLSLNAAIEAARAGEHGRGFSIVASEVRKLAEQSAVSAEQISKVVQKIREETMLAVKSMEVTIGEVKSGMGKVYSAGDSFENIQHSIQDVLVQIQEVSSATQVMAQNTSQVTDSISHVVRIAEESMSGTQELAAAAEEQVAAIQEISSSAAQLSDMSEQLKSLVSKFKI